MSTRQASASKLSTEARQQLINRLGSIVGNKHTLSDERSTSRFRKGFRFGDGPALAVVQPASLVEQWRVLKACEEADVIVIMQAANTGLTGGSTPDGDDYDRDIVIISTLRMDRIHLIHDGKQVVCLPGATLYNLEKALTPLGREPHSVIGSSCIGASVFGGVSNNSGGALVRRGPAYTEFAIYAQRDSEGELRLVNHLGIALGDDPEEILTRLENGDFSESDISDNGAASDHHYQNHVRHVDEDTPARFNADPTRLHEASGNAGKLALFAVRLDTFEAISSKVFYIGTNSIDKLTKLRRELLAEGRELPIAGEYMHRECFDIADVYGKDTFVMIEKFGTDKMPQIFAIKGGVDSFLSRFNIQGFTDRASQWLSRLFPDHLPKRMREYRDKYEHYLMLRVATDQLEETQGLLKELFADGDGDYFECTEEEGNKAFLHRFAAAGAAIRYRTVHKQTSEGMVALDVALRRNDTDWFEHLPKEIDDKLEKKLYYGHFLCHVMHQDYVVKKGNDCMDVEHEMWKELDARGAEYPAEHNVGHLYHAKPALAEHYQQLDPCNCFNPGIGQTSKLKYWGKQSQQTQANHQQS
ncbi:D-lactate dehydrogenase [Carnimonas nigrificans]|uniref:D-lactate dehydrogenase n=1 Tax=Carnimonas nigrificans TaxID=64323 RepID=UPI000472A3B8|nr:D-lactate dehydrogenase [Carnimonas nigrificans]